MHSVSEAAATVLEEPDYPMAKEIDSKSSQDKATQVSVVESQNIPEDKPRGNREPKSEQVRSDVHAYSSSTAGPG